MCKRVEKLQKNCRFILSTKPPRFLIIDKLSISLSVIMNTMNAEIKSIEILLFQTVKVVEKVDKTTSTTLFVR